MRGASGSGRAASNTTFFVGCFGFCLDAVGRLEVTLLREPFDARLPWFAIVPRVLGASVRLVTPSGCEPQALLIRRYCETGSDRLVIANSGPTHNARSGPNLGSYAYVSVLADSGTLPNVCVRVDKGTLADDGVFINPRATRDYCSGADAGAGLDVRTSLNVRLRVHFRAVRDEAAPVRVLAVSQRRAKVVFDVDVVLTHESSRVLEFSRYINNHELGRFIPTDECFYYWQLGHQ